MARFRWLSRRRRSLFIVLDQESAVNPRAMHAECQSALPTSASALDSVVVNSNLTSFSMRGMRMDPGCVKTLAGHNHFFLQQGAMVAAMDTVAKQEPAGWDLPMTLGGGSSGYSSEGEAAYLEGRRVSRRPFGGSATCQGSLKKARAEEPMVFMIDSDASTRQALESLVGSVRLRSATFESPMEFLGEALPDVPSCLVLDVRLRGMSGLDVQSRLTGDGVEIPVIFVTGYGDISMSVRAMKAGAADFLTKPCRDQDLLDAVMTAIESDRRRRNELARLRALQERFLGVTERERQIMALVAEGLLNKQIGAELGVSEFTVKVHRGSLMRKLKARSVPDLVRMADLLNAFPRNVSLFHSRGRPRRLTPVSGRDGRMLGPQS